MVGILRQGLAGSSRGGSGVPAGGGIEAGSPQPDRPGMLAASPKTRPAAVRSSFPLARSRVDEVRVQRLPRLAPGDLQPPRAGRVLQDTGQRGARSGEFRGESEGPGKQTTAVRGCRWERHSSIVRIFKVAVVCAHGSPGRSPGER
jgi:hypothetical protein